MSWLQRLFPTQEQAAFRRVSSLLVSLGVVLSLWSSYALWNWEEEKLSTEFKKAADNRSEFFGVHDSLLPWLSLGVGLAFTGLLGAYLLNLFRQGRRVQQLVQERTAQLRQANEGLQAEILARGQAEKRLADSLTEKEVLLREVHHRVKNNLQVITSLLQLEMGHLSEPASLKLLSNMRHRVRSMALVYEKLQGSAEREGIDFEEYARSLIADLLRANRVGRSAIRLEFEIEPSYLNLDTLVPCGLILNELVSNALKYAFGRPAATQLEPEQGGLIRIQLKRSPEGELLLRVSDNGQGLPAEFNLQAPPTLGLQIVKVLVEQLNGTLRLESQAGAAFSIRFRELVYKQRA